MSSVKLSNGHVVEFIVELKGKHYKQLMGILLEGSDGSKVSFNVGQVFSNIDSLLKCLVSVVKDEKGAEQIKGEMIGETFTDEMSPDDVNKLVTKVGEVVGELFTKA